MQFIWKESWGMGYGAEQLTLTKGIVSRVSHERYAHSSVNLPGCQIDAPINSGSSGGPVIKGKKVVGIANDGTINFRGDERTSYLYNFQRKQMEGTR